MRIHFLSTAAVAAAAAIGGAAIPATTNIGPTSSPPVAAQTPDSTIQPAEAARLAKQASFGPSQELIDDIVSKRSVSAWINSQFLLATSTYEDISSKPVPANFCSGQSGILFYDCTRENLSATPVQMRFYSNAVSNDDQLRQRVAFALSQIIVASEVDVHGTAGLAKFNQIFLENSFGNYRTILKRVTLNPYMGDYLDMVENNKTNPNENYARELLQLFSIGTTLLNLDGTQQIDSAGSPIAAYSNNDVKEISRALTGWIYSGLPKAAVIPDNNGRDLSKPMVPYASRFDAGSKSFLGKSIPAGATQEANVDAVIDSIFEHPNIAPFVSKRLIQQLTVSNPSPSYVGRVAAAFSNNGVGIRGDMKAVIRAIYLDPEARTAAERPGKVKEPVLLATSLARAIGFKSDGYAFTTRDAPLGQAPFRAPSVFNFYPYDFPLPQAGGLVSPATKLMTAPSSVYRHNLIYDWTLSGDLPRNEFQPQSAIPGSTGTTVDWASWEKAGSNDIKTIERINLVMLNGMMTSAQRASIASAMALVKNSDPALQARKRAQVALYIVATSPLFQVDR